MQARKIIDITRTFIPINPNAFPENMHSTQGEDSPENAPPVVPYMGHNFLATSRGYKSFFGTNFKATFNTLSPNKPEYVFLFQNLAYKNTVIALCDTGIFAKDANTAGAWTQLITLTAPAADVFYEWYYTIIKNKLYCFRANGAKLYEIETDLVAAVNVVCNELTPNFITIGNQLGMSRLGSRICFWDAENAIAWSSPDVLTDFTPSPLTGANVTTFTSIVGKISAIRPHGKGAIVYSTKNVVHLAVEPSEIFLVKARQILPAGVPYLRQSVAGAPDNVHFCQSASGFYKITDGVTEPIVPEVWDFLKELTAKPIYLKLLANRFLAFEVLDPDAIDGQPLFENVELPAETLTFPAVPNLEDYSGLGFNADWCEFMRLMDDALFPEQQSFAELVLLDKKPGTTAQPIWTCYVSQGNGVPDPVTWGHTPCGVAKFNGSGTGFFEHSPVGNGGKTSVLTTDATNKTAKTGAAVWTGGKWTMERFLAYQSAIWAIEEAKIAAFMATLLAKSETITVTTIDTTSCTMTNDAPVVCEIGTYPTTFEHRFGYNVCSFWMTRLATEATLVKNTTTHTIACTGDTPTLVNPSAYYPDNGSGSPDLGNPQPTLAAAIAVLPPGGSWSYAADPILAAGLPSPNASVNLGANFYAPSTNLYVWVEWTAAAGKNLVSQTAVPGDKPLMYEQYPAGHWDKTEVQQASNSGTVLGAGVHAIETAWCEITGWTYVDMNGVTQTVGAGACTNKDNMYYSPHYAPGVRSATTATQPDLVNDDGVVCDIPYPSDNLDNVQWPAEAVTYPALDWLFQDGSLAPRWPDIYGFYLYDTHLKKWSKCKTTYKQLLDYTPVNSETIPAVTTTNQGMHAGVLKSDGFIWIFDEAPTSSELIWGKLGYHRQGFSDIQELTFHFVKPATATIEVDCSFDGKSIVTEANFSESFTNKKTMTVYPSYSAKWFNIGISGSYDISDIIPVVNTRKGRR